jgi:hypothetical protein
VALEAPFPVLVYPGLLVWVAAAPFPRSRLHPLLQQPLRRAPSLYKQRDASSIAPARFLKPRDRARHLGAQLGRTWIARPAALSTCTAPHPLPHSTRLLMPIGVGRLPFHQAAAAVVGTSTLTRTRL